MKSYLPAFKMAVQEGGAWSIMEFLQPIQRPTSLSQPIHIERYALKGEWGSDGVVISDWGGTHDTGKPSPTGWIWNSAVGPMARNCQQRIRNYYLANPYLNLIREGKVGTTELTISGVAAFCALSSVR